MKIPNWLSSKIKKLTTDPIVYNEVLYECDTDVYEMLEQTGKEVRMVGLTPEGYVIIEDKIGKKSFLDILKENRRLNKMKRK